MQFARRHVRILTLALLALGISAVAHGGHGPHPFDGAWYDPAHDGEGWIVEVLPDDTAVVYWFTYPPAGGPGEQAWIQGVGQVADSAIEITESVITRGPAFGQDYDRADLEMDDWGTWTMTFVGCDRGTVVYDGPPEFGAGEFSMERLTGLQGSACGDGGPSDPETTGFSGSWYDPETDGQGITLEVLPDGAALIYWFTYSPEGEQAWVLGVGTAQGGRFEFPDMLMPVGTVFGPDFDPEAVEAQPWGSLSLTFDTCGAGVLSYRSELEDWGSGWMPLQRLTDLGAHPCELPPAPPLNKGSWAANVPMSPALSEDAGAVLDGKAYVAGDLGPNRRAFLRLDPAGGGFQRLADLPERRHHAMMAAHGGHIYLFGGFDDSFAATGTVWRYEPATDRWSDFGAMPGSIAAGTAVTVGDHIYVIPSIGVVRRLDPATGDWDILSGPGTEFRDHAAAVAYRGEIWWMGGRGFGFSGTLVAHDSVDIFDPVTRVWRPGPSMGRGHSGFAADVVQGQIMVAGGEHPGPTLPDWTLERSLRVYSPQDGRWFGGPDLPTPVHGVAGVALQDRFYLLGGSSVAGVAENTGFAQVYVPGS